MSDKEFAIIYLKTLEIKYNEWFSAAKTDIMNCVKIVDDEIISVHAVNKALPFEIKFDIESMFWVG